MTRKSASLDPLGRVGRTLTSIEDVAARTRDGGWVEWEVVAAEKFSYLLVC
jgi:hypothetical protein